MPFIGPLSMITDHSISLPNIPPCAQLVHADHPGGQTPQARPVQHLRDHVLQNIRNLRHLPGLVFLLHNCLQPRILHYAAQWHVIPRSTGWPGGKWARWRLRIFQQSLVVSCEDINNVCWGNWIFRHSNWSCEWIVATWIHFSSQLHLPHWWE